MASRTQQQACYSEIVRDTPPRLTPNICGHIPSGVHLLSMSTPHRPPAVCSIFEPKPTERQEQLTLNKNCTHLHESGVITRGDDLVKEHPHQKQPVRRKLRHIDGLTGAVEGGRCTDWAAGRPQLLDVEKSLQSTAYGTKYKGFFFLSLVLIKAVSSNHWFLR